MTKTELGHAKAHRAELTRQRRGKVEDMAGADADRVERLYIETAALGAAITFLAVYIEQAETNATEEVTL